MRVFPALADQKVRQLVPLLISCVFLMAGPQVFAADEKGPHSEHNHGHYNRGSAEPTYHKTSHTYDLPDVQLRREDGTEVAFPADIDNGRPVVLNFIFTTCTTICPVLSQTFADFQALLGPDVEKVHMVSVSIDPEQDTPERLASYAARYHAKPQWTHYTGSVEASLQVQKAFQAFYVDKMNHRPLTFLRRTPGESWIRLDGFMSGEDLVREYHQLIGSPA